MSTTLKYSANCAWCNCFMKRGEKTWLLKTEKFDAYIRELISRICGKNRINAIGPKLEIMSFLVQPRTWRFQEYCTDCGHFDIKFSRSGRTIFTPMRLQDEIFVSGSQHVGCDQYDRGYDDGKFRDGEYESHSNLRGFVVDDEIPSDDQENSDSEDEWSESSSEEDYDSDRDWA